MDGLRQRKDCQKTANRLVVSVRRDGKTRDEKRLSEFGDSRTLDGASIQTGSFAPGSKKHFVVNRIEDRSNDHLTATFQPDRDAIVRESVDIIRGPIERVDDPAIVRIAPVNRKTFFATKAAGTAQYIERV